VVLDEDPDFILFDLLVALDCGLEIGLLEDLGLDGSNRGMISSGRMV